MPHPRAPHSEDDGYEAQGSRAFTRFLSGLAAFSVGVFICGACSSYSASDPSFNMAIARVREAISIPLIANGDGNTVADAQEMLAKSGADGVDRESHPFRHHPAHALHDQDDRHVHHVDRVGHDAEAL